MGKWCLHASSFIFDQIIIKVAGNQDRHKSLVEFDFGPNQPTHFGVTCPWVTKISHFWTLISLKPVGQSWSSCMCSIIGVGERLHEVLGQINLGKLDSGERSLPFGLLVLQSLQWILFSCGVMIEPCLKFYAVPSQSQCMTLRSRSQTLNFLVLNLYSVSCYKAFDWFESCLVWMDIRF